MAPYLLSNINGASLIAEDGSLAMRFPAPSGGSFIRADFVNGERELLLLSTNETRTGYVLKRNRDDGTQLWSKALDNVRFSQNVTIRGLSDGRALVLISDVSRLQVRLYSTAGFLTETRDVDLPELVQPSFGVWTQDGMGNHGLVLEFETGFSVFSHSAIIFSANGTLLKQTRYANDQQCTQDCPLLGLAQGFANVLSTTVGGKLVITNLAPSAPNIETELTGNYKARIANSADDTILMTSKSGFRAFTARGVEIPAPSMLAKSVTQPSVIASVIANDGKSFILHQFYDGQYVTRLDAFAANGTKLWQRTVRFVQHTQLIANSARVCFRELNNNFVGDTALSCFASASGVELISVTIPNKDAFKSQMRFLDDGRLRLVYGLPLMGLKVVDVANDNQITQSSISSKLVSRIFAIGGNGSILLSTGPRDFIASEWFYLRPNGDVFFTRSFSFDLSIFELIGQVLKNDQVLLGMQKSISSETFDVMLLNSDGSQQWKVPTAKAVTNVLVDNNCVYLSGRIGAYTGSDSSAINPITLQALAIFNGRTVWAQELKSPRNSVVTLFASPNINEFLVSSDDDLGVQLSRISGTNGSVVEQRMFPCESASCRAEATAIDPAGNFRTITLAQDPGRSTITLGSAEVGAIKPGITIDQSGLSGAWHTPQISGQGFFIQYFPQSNLLFAPWFTYSDTDSVLPCPDCEDFDPAREISNSNTPANLRWYTLSGVVEPGAKVAQLEIYRNSAGIFDSAPITQSTVVGKATLRATDCNRATLEFEFVASEAGGKYGVIPLDRLTGGSAPCRLNPAQNVPGRDARPARAGFDARQSGAWYKPQTSGQGVMMTVQPATDAAPGFLFGGWFTYDAGTPNDLSTQHWLTLSAEIPVSAQAGVVPVTIYRTLGGKLASVPTQNYTVVGHGSVSFNGCANAVLRYQFDDALTAGSFRARAGEINLERLATCPTE